MKKAKVLRQLWCLIIRTLFILSGAHQAIASVWLLNIRTALIFRGDHQAKASSSQVHQAKASVWWLMIMDDNEKFNKTIKKTNLRFSSNFVFWMEEVEVVEHVEHLYSFILIIIMLPLCSPVLIHYIYECEEDDKDYRWDDIWVIEDELKHKNWSYGINTTCRWYRSQAQHL